MVISLITIGAVFIIWGKVFGILSLLRLLRFQKYLRLEHKEIFDRLAVSGGNIGDQGGNAENLANLWKYVNSPEDDDIVGIKRFKMKIRRYFQMFVLLCGMGIISVLAAVVALFVFHA